MMGKERGTNREMDTVVCDLLNLWTDILRGQEEEKRRIRVQARPAALGLT